MTESATAQPDPTVAALRRFVVECADLRELERSLRRFNVFDVLRSSQNEIRHSNILAWLLDPSGTHGLDELFLRRWLMEVLNSAAKQDRSLDIDPVEVDAEPFERIEVWREWNHIDVVIRMTLANGIDWVFAIENKVNATQGKYQLSGYRKKIEQSFSSSKRVFLFLTKEGEAPEDDEFIPTTYDSVQRTVDLCLAEGDELLGSGPLYLLQQYNALLKEHFMDNTAATELALKIYRAHKEALDFIFEKKPDQIKRITDSLVAKLETDGMKNVFPFVRSTKGCVTTLPKTWATTNNMGTDAWPGIGLEIRIDQAKVVLAAQVRSNVKDQALRDELLQEMKAINVLPATRTKAYPNWFTFYSHKITGIALEEEDVEAVVEEIWKKVEQTMQADKFKKMNTKVVDVLSRLIVT